MRLSARSQSRLAAIIAASLLLAGGYALFRLARVETMPALERILRQGQLVVATRRSPTTYYQGANGPNGFEYTLVHAFADHLGVDVRFVFPPTIDAMLDATARGTVHMAAAGLAVTPARAQRVAFSIPYDAVTAQVIYRRGSRRPRSPTELGDGELHVIAGSSHEEMLLALRESDFPELDWTPHAHASNDRLLDAVDQGRLPFTVVDSHTAQLSGRVFRHAIPAFDLGDEQPVAWAFRNGDDDLREAADRFLQQMSDSGRLQRLQAQFFGHSGRMNFVDSREFWRGVRDRLPALRPHFERAAADTGIDWRLLAAIGYQESHWRSDAVSPTGVRGVMMLTRDTARQVGVDDRNDPAQSIMGGAKYLRIVEKKIPKRIKRPNRLWLTLAGYNVGFGHLEDARILTQRDGADPDLWMDVKRYLPLLTQKKYYETVRHGFARGQEPVDYVDNIRNYYDLLVWFTTTGDRKTVERLLAAEEA